MAESSDRKPDGQGPDRVAPVTGENIAKVVELERKQKLERNFVEKTSDLIAQFAGSMTFVYLHVLWFGGWILFNVMFLSEPFDPFPFTFLTLIVSLEAIFLSTFILISQNQETRLTERRNQLDLQIDLLAEQENTKMLELLRAIAERVGAECDDEDVAPLLEPVEPAKIAEEIREAASGVTEPHTDDAKT